MVWQFFAKGHPLLSLCQSRIAAGVQYGFRSGVVGTSVLYRPVKTL